MEAVFSPNRASSRVITSIPVRLLNEAVYCPPLASTCGSDFMQPYAGGLPEMIVDGKNGATVLDRSGGGCDIEKREEDVSAMTPSPIIVLLLLQLEFVQFLRDIRNVYFSSQFDDLSGLLFPDERLHGGDDGFGFGLLAGQFLNLGNETFRYVQGCTHMFHLNVHSFYE